MDYAKFARKQIAAMQRTVGERDKVISALSGGVDSSVATLLGHRAFGQRLEVVFIDDGLMRQDEPTEVQRTFARLGIRVEVLNAQQRFFNALAGLTDPEEKRKAFRDTFYKTLGDAVKRSGARWLLQGTIAADILETKKGVKTQHNILEQIGIDPRKGYGFGVLEPVKTLFKDGVRALGARLGLPKAMHQRMPFPGPGLSCRVVGEVTPERVEVVRQGCRIVEQETARFKPFQAFTVLLADRATGLAKGGKRAFGQIVSVRVVDSKNALTARVPRLPWPALERIRDRILKEIPGVTKVVYDLTPKPPSTIEYI